jgi:hypothetical protein
MQFAVFMCSDYMIPEKMPQAKNACKFKQLRQAIVKD